MNETTNETQTTKEYAPMRVKHIPEHFALVTDSQEIRATLETIGCLSEIDNVGCLFVEVLDGDYGTVFACERSIPYLEEPVRALDAYGKLRNVYQKA